MALKVFNTMSRRKEVFQPIKKGQVGMYSCGPTVYDYAHIGNFRAYIAADLIRRYLKFKGFRLKHVMNITDVDDKTIKGSKKAGIPLEKFTAKYTKAFFEDVDALNIERVEVYPRATKHIKEMAALVKTLLKKGYAYKGRDAVYYSISKFLDYGKLAHLENAHLKTGARVKQDEYDKEHAHDFALWKLWDKEDGKVFWNTEVGRGRPGWHIECSAMSMKHLGPSFDIHTGGVDLIFPHHQNEIAQSEAANGKEFVKYWLHNEHLIVEGQKMSKSLGNFFTLRDLLKKGHGPMAIRYLLLATHYRQKLNLTDEALKASGEAVERLREFVARARKGRDGKVDSLIKKAKAGFEKAMDDDFNTPEALSVVFEFVREANKAGAGRKALEALLDFDRVLGLKLGEAEGWERPEKAPKEVKTLILKREELRKARDWKASDNIRDQLREKGIILQDTEKGPRYKGLGSMNLPCLIH